MKTVSYDEKSFMIDGKRVWLNLGEIHYFRFPREEWRTVIRMAKAAGVNTIATYLAWNYHELSEGVFDFTGDRNFAEFIDIAAEEGMYVFLRPGPYICAEWCGGGLPSWILNYETMEQRTDDADFMRCTENWFREALKFAIPRLVTHGGNIIAVQNDNEYPGGWDDKGASYIKKAYDLLRKYGVDVPITACNAHYKNNKLAVNYDAHGNWEEIYKDIIVTYNTSGEAAVIPELKAFQPKKPTMVTELWTGAQIFWGRPFPKNWNLQGKNICRFCALQSQVNLYMFAGGNNYAYYGGNNIATSYASTYPIGEGNNPTSAYYDAKVIGSFVSSFGDFVSSCQFEMIDRDREFLQTGKEGKLRYVIGENEQKTAAGAWVKNGKKGWGVYPENFIFGGKTVNSSEFSLFGRKDALLFFVGEAGEEGKITVEGKEYSVFVKRQAPSVIDADGIYLIVCDMFTAERTWMTVEGILFGYDMAYDTEKGVYTECSSARTVYCQKDGKLSAQKVNADKVTTDLPSLTAWETTECGADLAFQPIEKPMPHQRLGVNHGYVWYKAEVFSEEEKCTQMLIPAFHNRIFAYVNGKFAGIFGDKRNNFIRWEYKNPTDSLTEPVTVRLQKGKNEVIFLSEDTGYHFDDTKPMGILSDVYADVHLQAITDIKDSGRAPIWKEAYDYMYCKITADAKELNQISFAVDLQEDEDMFFVVHGAPCYVYVNGKPTQAVRPIYRPWETFCNTVIWATYLSESSSVKNKVELQYYCTTAQLLAGLRVYVYKKKSKLTDWAFSPFAEKPSLTGKTDYQATAQQASTLLVPGGDFSFSATNFLPKYFTTKFSLPQKESLLLDIGTMKKGQIFLNGKNVGKFNGKEIQAAYYLPAAYLQEENTLTLFEEYGTAPNGVAISSVKK